MADSAKGRLVQTFKYLKELNNLRNPVARDLQESDVFRIDLWPLHPCIQVLRGDQADDGSIDTDTQDSQSLIRIQRAALTTCPKPPAILDGWLKPGWDSAENKIEVLESRNYQDNQNQTRTVSFKDLPDHANALSEWAITRNQWAKAEQPAAHARKIFDQIYSLWTRMERDGDSVELVLADGVLSVNDPLVKHPVLLQRANLKYEPAGPEFHIDTGTEKVELHRSLLRLIPTIQSHMIALFDKELEEQPVFPLGGESTDSFLRRLIQGLFSDGEYVDKKRSQGSAGGPVVWRDPVLFLRRRTGGVSSTLDYIVESLEVESNVVSEGLSRIVGIERQGENNSSRKAVGEQQSSASQHDPDILFSKPGNSEQYAIAERLTKSRAVLVQGPPGTGKTHTIANLLGYLLSRGKTVLVTAHTTKALRVLRQKVDVALQPLAISVLEGNAESQEQLSKAAQQIADRLSRSDAVSLRVEASSLREKRHKMLKDADTLRQRIRDARFSEVEEIVYGGEGTSPIEVAKRVKSDAERDSWIPGPLETNQLCPLDKAEVDRLYATQAILQLLDEEALEVAQPTHERLVALSDFTQFTTEQNEASLRAKAHRPDLWSQSNTIRYSSRQLQELKHQVNQSVEILNGSEKWLNEVLFAGWSGGDLQETWRELVDEINTTTNEAAKTQRLNSRYGLDLPKDRPLDQVIEMLEGIVRYYEVGKSLGLKSRVTRRPWHQLLKSCRVEGRLPQTKEEIKALLTLAHLQRSRNRLAARWHRCVEQLGGPSIEGYGPQLERSAQGYVDQITARLEWRGAVWEPLILKLCEAGFAWDTWLAAHPPISGDHGELARVQQAVVDGLSEIVEAKAARIRIEELTKSLESQRMYLGGFPQSELAKQLQQAQDTWNVDSYEEVYSELSRLDGLRAFYDDRLRLLDRLNSCAPHWVRAIADRESPHDLPYPPGDPESAWRWRQWLQELERRASVSISQLQQELDRTEDELRQVAVQIIECETWAAQRERTGLQAQQALVGYVQTIAKIGKGTGKRAPLLLQEARKLLASARAAVPVWIMPLHRVYESFDPRQTKFDVVIIDEASQSDVTALAALYLGREHVVVGDKEQVTPDAIGEISDDVQRLIATDLQGIPNSHLYDGQTSIYDLAEAAFGGVISLREHFRCVPEIIQFSNHLSYGNSILPLREPLSASVRPALVAHRVNGCRDTKRKINRTEAEEITALMIACLRDPRYQCNESGQPTTFGVITLLGDDQALLIDELLRKYIALDDYTKHRLLCGNAAQFQGDERDVIFLSMVDGPPDDGPMRLLSTGQNNRNKKRYNVATSRARNQLWVVYSMDPEIHLKSDDLRRRLIRHAQDPLALVRAIEEQGQRTESIFEKLVLDRLMQADYRVKPQWSVGAYRIDLVVEGKSRKLAVECDGERWHTPAQLQKDLERQAILERLGWKFVRIRGSVFFRDPDAALEPVFTKLDQLNIEKLGHDSTLELDASQPFVDGIRKAAEAIRRQWADGESD